MPHSFRTAKTWATRRVVPAYTKQLDLFSEANTEPPAPDTDVRVRRLDVSNSKPRPPVQLDFGSWEPLPPEEVINPRRPISAQPASVDGGNTARQSSVPTGSGQQEEGSDRIEAAPVRVPDADKVFEIELAEKPSCDFRITTAQRIGDGGLHEKARDNLAAIRLVKVLEAENRDATGEEQAVLARYVGWGAISGVFGIYGPPEWRSIAAAVKENLNEAEFQSARASTPNAHFTSPLVIEAIWRGLETMGLGKGAQILEPAMGVGHFFGLMPESMRGAHRTGVELDSITARISKKLYPDATVFAQGFEETPLPDNYFDVVVGNVPFG